MMKKIGATSLVLALGCGAATGPVPEYRLEISKRLMGTVFGDGLLPPPEPTPRKKDMYLQVEIDRLKTAGWREAEIALIRYGKEAIPPLIDLLDSNEGSQAVIKPIGREVRTKSLAYTVGQVAYHVLVDIVGHRTNWKKELPPFDKEAWEDWWRRNESRITFCWD